MEPAADWPDAFRPLDPLLSGVRSSLAMPGQDRYDDVGPDSFFGTDDVGLLPVGGIEPVEESGGVRRRRPDVAGTVDRPARST